MGAGAGSAGVSGIAASGSFLPVNQDFALSKKVLAMLGFDSFSCQVENLGTMEKIINMKQHKIQTHQELVFHHNLHTILQLFHLLQMIMDICLYNTRVYKFELTKYLGCN